MGSVISISPQEGTAGTLINITGTNFSTVLCENRVFIGSSYECPILNASETEIICEIASNSSLDPRVVQNVIVLRDEQGYLSNDGLIQFQLQPSISNIWPIQGYIFLF